MPEFNAARFCGDLYIAACDHAKQRIGEQPKSGQLQMFDFFKAFSQLKSQQYSHHFGPVAGEWNEAMAMIKAYTTAYIQEGLPASIAESISKALHSWVYYSKLPKATRDELSKLHQELGNISSKLEERMKHFVREYEFHVSHVNAAEREALLQLIRIYQPKMHAACQKKDHASINSLLHDMDAELERLSSEKASRELDVFYSKTHHEICNVKSLLAGKS
jgi:hypothetical protein